MKDFKKTSALSDFRSSKALAIATLCLAFFTDDFIYGLLVPVLPFSLRIKSEVPENELQFWTSSMMAAFGLANLMGSPPLGWLADKSPSRRFLLLIGLVMQGVATLLFGFGSEVHLLVASRLLQGLSAAITYTGGLALLVDTVGHDNIGKWMGLVLSFANAGILISPIIGGVLYGNLGYSAVFIFMGILVLLDLSLRLLMADKRPFSLCNKCDEEESPHLNPCEDGRQSEVDPLLNRIDSSRQGVFSRIKRSLPVGILLLGKTRVAAAIFGVVIAQIWVTSFDAVLPLFLSRTFGWGSTQAGFMFLALSIPTLAAPVAGILSDRYGPRRIAATASSIAACTHALLPLATQNTMDQIILLCVFLIIVGLCYSAMISPLAADLAAVVEQVTAESPHLESSAGSYGQVFALLNCALAAGIFAGPPIAGLTYERSGWSAVGWTSAALSGVGALLIVCLNSHLLEHHESLIF